MLADKPRLGIGLGAINFFPGALHKRPSAGLANDCWYAGIVAIVGFVHLGGRRANRGPYGPILRRKDLVVPKSNVRFESLADDVCCLKRHLRFTSDSDRSGFPHKRAANVRVSSLAAGVPDLSPLASLVRS